MFLAKLVFVSYDILYSFVYYRQRLTITSADGRHSGNHGQGGFNRHGRGIMIKDFCSLHKSVFLHLQLCHCFSLLSGY